MFKVSKQKLSAKLNFVSRNLRSLLIRKKFENSAVTASNFDEVFKKS